MASDKDLCEYWIDYAHSTYSQFGTDIEDAAVKWCEDYDHLITPTISDIGKFVYIRIYDVEEERYYEYRIEGEWHLKYICKEIE